MAAISERGFATAYAFTLPASPSTLGTCVALESATLATLPVRMFADVFNVDLFRILIDRVKHPLRFADIELKVVVVLSLQSLELARYPLSRCVGKMISPQGRDLLLGRSGQEREALPGLFFDLQTICATTSGVSRQGTSSFRVAFEAS